MGQATYQSALDAAQSGYGAQMSELYQQLMQSGALGTYGQLQNQLGDRAFDADLGLGYQQAQGADLLGQGTYQSALDAAQSGYGSQMSQLYQQLMQSGFMGAYGQLSSQLRDRAFDANMGLGYQQVQDQSGLNWAQNDAYRNSAGGNYQLQTGNNNLSMLAALNNLFGGGFGTGMQDTSMLYWL